MAFSVEVVLNAALLVGRAGHVSVRPFLFGERHRSVAIALLEGELQPQLHSAAASGSDDWIGCTENRIHVD